MIRSSANLVQCDEKFTKYFLNLEKRNQKTKNITTIINETGNEIISQNEILIEEESFYKKLYCEPPNIAEHDLTLCDIIHSSKKLNDADKETCEIQITVNEIGLNLKNLPNNKSPGSDGLSAEFYKIFWNEIKHFLYDSYTYSFKSGTLSIDQRRAILTLIPKANKDLRYLKNWRSSDLIIEHRL